MIAITHVSCSTRFAVACDRAVGMSRRESFGVAARTRNPGAARARLRSRMRVATTLYYDAMTPSPTGGAGSSAPPSAPSAAAATDTLDAWVREVVEWHFDPASGCPFWLDFAKNTGRDPRREIRAFADLKGFGEFQDEWLRGG